VDQLSWEFEVNKIEDKYLSDIIDGVYVTGLYLEGADWDRKQGTLCEAPSMQLITLMPTIHFKPVEHKKKLSKGNLLKSQEILIINDYRSLYCTMLLFINSCWIIYCCCRIENRFNASRTLDKTSYSFINES